MRFFQSVIPNLSISLNIAMLIVIYLDMRNPMMGFLRGTPYAVLVAATAICSVISAVGLIAQYRKRCKE